MADGDHLYLPIRDDRRAELVEFDGESAMTHQCVFCGCLTTEPDTMGGTYIHCRDERLEPTIPIVVLDLGG